MSSQVEICNIALQKLGASPITSLSQDTKSAIECNTAFIPRLKALLRKHAWNFAIERAELAADATEPDWGRANAFQLPSDFLRLLPAYPEDVLNTDDYQIEGSKIYTDEDAPLYIRYIKYVDDAEAMDPLFREVLACDLAVQMCEALTQSNTKKAGLKEDLREALQEARRANAFESVAQTPPTSVWTTARD